MMSLELLGAGFTYRGGASAALTGIDLRLAPGQMHAILGPLGSGTSTLGRLITGLLSDRGTSVGRIRVEGAAVMLGDDPEAQLSGMTSLVGDEVQLPGRLHGDEVSVVEERARQVLRSLGIGDLWGRRLDTLSGGQRQLVTLAGLLTVNPSLLVLDQPSLSLDPDARRRLGTVLRAFCSAGGAVLITAHQFDEVTEACDHLSVLDSGRLITTDICLAAHELERCGIWDTRPREPHESYEPRGQDPSEPVGSTAPATVALSVRGLTVARAGATVLKHIDLDVASGEIVTIRGSNGAGKSTLLRSLAGLLGAGDRTSGMITVDGNGTRVSLGDARAHERAQHLGWVGQDPGSQLSAATVRDELLHAVPLPSHRRRDRATIRARRQEAVTSAMETAHLDTVSETHPYDLSIDLRKDLVMASALIMSPRILLLDEPTLGRDGKAINRLNIFIREFLRRGGSILATTHDRRWAATTADHILELDEGRLREDRETGERAGWG
ncbi:ATP-binding cassette domain-containing protein [Brevibacterium antiquum]|uniref:Energy-coupling factor transport system ATP-binding protein n=1 Tax=Brevibacterium antiquum TaxID=234835 RepID=A0A2H1IVD0_9MICO|nr:ATP-binding cassette domain-containing protein [Brevibacterium antiquum]SMX79090.1 energy-coupling factor transport system ATP-binding protein [Brevibacterium antiquum]